MALRFALALISLMFGTKNYYTGWRAVRVDRVPQSPGRVTPWNLEIESELLLTGALKLAAVQPLLIAIPLKSESPAGALKSLL